MASQVIMVAFILVAILCISKTDYSDAGAGGFTAEFIHRDSPLSPTYDPSATDYDRLKAALNRTVLRRNLISDSLISLKRSEFRARVMSYHYEYLMKIQVGTPPVTIYPILDTGSDISWAKCLPCTNCSPNSSQFYNPEKSSSYQTLTCNSTSCDQSRTPRCIARPSKDGSSSPDFDPCEFFVQYADGSMTKGNMVKETIGLGSSSLPGIIFGCAHDLRGSFPGSGIIGLGTGPTSLIKQMGKSAGSKFSYCLPTVSENLLTANKISFGNKAIISGPDVVTTPIIATPTTYYYFVLKGFTGPNGKRINLTEDETRGNIIIDSGTTLTLLPKEVCENIEQSYREAIEEKPIEGGVEGLRLCYKANVKIPSIKVHLGGGAEMVLPSTNTFFPFGKGEDLVMCLTLLPTGSVSIYGNLWQQNMHVGYDLDNNLLSFKYGCTKY